VDAVGGGRQDVFELVPPAYFLAQLLRSLQLGRGGQPPAAGLGQPAAGVVEGPGELGAW
jgi:hypothetical protein